MLNRKRSLTQTTQQWRSFEMSNRGLGDERRHNPPNYR